MRRLAVAINDLADAYCAQRDDVEARISDANARLEAEKNRFAALLSDLTQGVLVCNSEGRILLYNARAQQLLDERGEEGHIGGAFVGLGRSIFAVMDKSVIVHALDAVRHKLADDSADPSAQLVTTRHRGQLVRANIAPILDRERNVGGFVLTLENITRSVDIDSRRDALLQSLTEGTRASLANIRAAIETMLAYPAMAEEHRHRFAAVINDEAAALSARLTETVSEHADTLKAQWPLEDMSGADLLAVIRRRLESRTRRVGAGRRRRRARVAQRGQLLGRARDGAGGGAGVRGFSRTRDCIEPQTRGPLRAHRIGLAGRGLAGIDVWEGELLRSDQGQALGRGDDAARG